MGRAVVVIAINLFVGLLHFVTGERYAGPFRDFANGYLIDITLPFAVYFLLCMVEKRIHLLERWWLKSALVTGAGLFFEVMQYFGIPLLGRTFDPVDIAMYALGGLLAAFFDRVVFWRLFGFWRPGR